MESTPPANDVKFARWLQIRLQHPGSNRLPTIPDAERSKGPERFLRPSGPCVYSLATPLLVADRNSVISTCS